MAHQPEIGQRMAFGRRDPPLLRGKVDKCLAGSWHQPGLAITSPNFSMMARA
jgi:hypothetical protein